MKNGLDFSITDSNSEMPSMSHGRNLPEILFRRAQAKPSAIAYRFFQGPTLVPEALTFSELWAQAADLASSMQSRELFEKRVLLTCKSQKYFVVAFFACLLTGAIAVPTALPRRQHLRERLEVLDRDAQFGAIISDSDDLQLIEFAEERAFDVHIDMRKWASEYAPAENAACWIPPVLDDDAIAFLQYTSGSTGDPKGVVVTHANLINNCFAIQQGMGFSEESAIFTALPLFHDMGLVGGVLQSMYSGGNANLMSPAEFIQYPERWLQILSNFKITISGGPNFMYDLAARSIRLEDLKNIDLSHWRIAFCGAEPIRYKTVESFVRKFEPFGFRPSSFYPCYGMAESTLFVSGVRIDACVEVDRRNASEIVGCGYPRHDTQVCIVDPESLRQMQDGQEGEIWVSGSSVAHGYWRRPELTEKYFQARMAADDSRHFLRTGDLGYLKNGELFVTGRLKDLIIAYGKKYLPQDVEDNAERSHVALRESGGAAFSVTRDAVDRTVLVFELKREWLRRSEEWPQILNAARAAVGESLGLMMDEIVLIKTGSLPRTSSGKVRRGQCSLDYLENRLERIA